MMLRILLYDVVELAFEARKLMFASKFCSEENITIDENRWDGYSVEKILHSSCRIMAF